MDDEDLIVLALAVVARDLSLAKKMVHFARDGVLEEGEMQEKLKLPSAELRQLLYRMQDSNLVIQLGTKEDESGNRLTYWRINRDIAGSFLIRKIKDVLNMLRKRREEESLGEYYVCAADPTHVRLSFDEVIAKMGEESGSLVCPVCGAMLEPVNKEKVLEDLDRMIEILERALGVLEGEAG